MSEKSSNSFLRALGLVPSPSPAPQENETLAIEHDDNELFDFEDVSDEQFLLLIKNQVTSFVQEWAEVHDSSTSSFITKNLTPDILEQSNLEHAKALELSQQLESMHDSDSNLVSLIEVLFQLYGGQINNNEDSPSSTYSADFDSFALIENLPWWKTFRERLQNQGESDFLKKWRDGYMSAFDEQVKISYGRTGRAGRFFSIVLPDSLLKKRGEKQLVKLEKRLKRFTKELKPSFLEGLKHKIKSLFDPSIIVNIDRTDRYHKKQEDYQIILDYLQNTSMPTSQRINEIFNFLESQGIKYPKQIGNQISRFKAIHEMTDSYIDAKHDSKLFALLYILIITFKVAPLSSEDTDKLLEEVKKFSADTSDSVKEAFQTWLVDEMPELSKQVVLSLAQFIPSTALAEFSLSPEFRSFMGEIENSTVTLETANSFSQALIEYAKNGRPELDLSIYTPQQQEELLALQDVENPYYQSVEQLFDNATVFYQQTYFDQYGIEPLPLTWQNHPDAVTTSQIMTGLTEHSLEDALYSPLFSEDVQTILARSGDSFMELDHVVDLYTALYPGREFSEQQVAQNLADYHIFILEHYANTNQPVSISTLLGYALVQNEGDVSAALWDVTIAIKTLTRNNIFDFSINGSADSGLLFSQLIADPFSEGATATDLITIIPPDWWDITFYNEGELGYKEYDPADRAGITYHILNLLALRTTLPSESILLGTIYESIFFASNNEYGDTKVEQQIRYLSQNIHSFEQIVETYQSSSNEVQSLSNSDSTVSLEEFILNQDSEFRNLPQSVQVVLLSNAIGSNEQIADSIFRNNIDLSADILTYTLSYSFIDEDQSNNPVEVYLSLVEEGILEPFDFMTALMNSNHFAQNIYSNIDYYYNALDLTSSDLKQLLQTHEPINWSEFMLTISNNTIFMQELNIEGDEAFQAIILQQPKGIGVILKTYDDAWSHIFSLQQLAESLQALYEQSLSQDSESSDSEIIRLINAYPKLSEYMSIDDQMLEKIILMYPPGIVDNFENYWSAYLSLDELVNLVKSSTQAGGTYLYYYNKMLTTNFLFLLENDIDVLAELVDVNSVNMLLDEIEIQGSKIEDYYSLLQIYTVIQQLPETQAGDIARLYFSFPDFFIQLPTELLYEESLVTKVLEYSPDMYVGHYYPSDQFPEIQQQIESQLQELYPDDWQEILSQGLLLQQS